MRIRLTAAINRKYLHFIDLPNPEKLRVLHSHPGLHKPLTSFGFPAWKTKRK